MMPCPFSRSRRSEGGCYVIRVRERIDPFWSTWLGGMSIAHEPEGTTLLTGEVTDQAALHGLLTRIRDMQLTLLSLQLVGFRLEGEVAQDEM
ncbi:MAG: hypothetical protein SFU56_20640 [Capsulimonadales bacterium]|nr:hypothetical protein [Capsulimonadales bacterium]